MSIALSYIHTLEETAKSPVPSVLELHVFARNMTSVKYFLQLFVYNKNYTIHSPENFRNALSITNVLSSLVPDFKQIQFEKYFSQSSLKHNGDVREK